MALEAIDIPVFSSQLKLCFVVVEQNLLPFIGDMALLTLRPEDAFVFIILAVAPDTGHGRGFKVSRLVAVFALDIAVFAFQRESSLGMVKMDLGPYIGRAAVLTLLA